MKILVGSQVTKSRMTKIFDKVKPSWSRSDPLGVSGFEYFIFQSMEKMVEVVEVFSYMCPHCRTFQPYVGPWHENLPENVEFSGMPVSFSPSWEAFARAYYTAEVLGILDESHNALFAALHDERQPIRTMDDLAEFHTQFGVSAEEFKSTAASFPVESRMRMGNASIGKWQVRSTPTLVINGKYRVGPRRGGTFEELLQVADMLIARELEAAAPADS